MDRAELINKLRKFCTDNKYVAIILILGIFLMLIPSPKKDRQSSYEENIDKSVDTTPLQQSLSDILSQFAGAGKVLVLLTESEGEKTIYHQDEYITSDSAKYDTVIVSNSEKNQEALKQSKLSPVYRGAVILAQGADNAAVRLALTDAVSKATGLSSDRIIVLKMK